MLNKIYQLLCFLCVFGCAKISFGQTRNANPSNINQIINWVKDGSTQKIIFEEGTYVFTQTISLENDNLEFEGAGKGKTILKLGAVKNTLLDAKGDNAFLHDLTLDGNKNQKTWGNPIFRFNKSRGHRFEDVLFTNSLWMGIAGINAYPTHGLNLKRCEFSNIDLMCLQIFNRNTNSRGGVLILNVDKVTIDDCIFREGYQTGISSDNGNDRQNSGDGTGKRYTESTSLNGTEIKNCVFEKSKQFHIAMVQSKDVIIQNNTFYGMTDDAGSGSQPIHMEQFTQNIEFYNNILYMPTTVSKPYTYFHINGTEGHKRVTQQRSSATYATWTYNVFGSNERRANTSCAKTGHLDADCKRDVHAYGARNIYIAGNTFNESTGVAKYIFINEGENIQIGTKKDGTISLNNFIGGTATTKKISFGGNDEGTGNVLIRAGQNITKDNLDIKDVQFDLPAVRLVKPIVVETSLGVVEFEENQEPFFYPNPALDTITLNSIYNVKELIITNISGVIVKRFAHNDIDNNMISLEGINPGVYILVLATISGDTLVNKLILK
jgi:hypothetical protein